MKMDKINNEDLSNLEKKVIQREKQEVLASGKFLKVIVSIIRLCLKVCFAFLTQLL